MILCSEEDCEQPPGAGALAQFTHERRKKAHEMVVYIKHQLAVFISALKRLWTGLTDYLKTIAEDTLKDINEFFAKLLKEKISIPAYDLSILTKKE